MKNTNPQPPIEGCEERIKRNIKINKYLRNYGLDDDATLNAGEVEELCQDIVSDFIQKELQAKDDYYKGVIREMTNGKHECNMCGGEECHCCGETAGWNDHIDYCRRLTSTI